MYSSDHLLSIQNISKDYAAHKALQNISLEIEKGKIFGLLGPNGAGKTSLIRIINQITAPDSGEIFFNGKKLNPSHIPQIGYLPEERGLYKKMEIGEQILYLARLKGLSKADAIQKIKFWFSKLDIESWWNKKVEDLSKGMQQKVQFVATVLHEPPLLILDEPFSGFDPVNAEIIKNEILELNKKGTTVIFSTHRMESVEQMCDHIALIHQSKKILDGEIKTIRQEYRNQTYKIGYTGQITNATKSFDILHPIVLPQQEMTIRIREAYTVNDVLAELLPVVQISYLTEVIPSIHEIFIEKVGTTSL